MYWEAVRTFPFLFFPFSIFPMLSVIAHFYVVFEHFHGEKTIKIFKFEIYAETQEILFSDYINTNAFSIPFYWINSVNNTHKY